ncbi:MAG: hypothetical protein IIW08_04350, partial [Clostridia bacterium]|nr:hypothetical protein [Clostridia bacterium]
MSKFIKTVLLLALVLAAAFSVYSAMAEETGKDIVIVNRTGFSIAEFYLTSESNVAYGPLRNRAWIKSGEEIVVSLTDEELLIDAWKAHIGVSRGGKVV